MTAGLINIVTFNVNELFLTGNPQFTFFKSIYKKYTNFAIETIPIYADNNNVNFDELTTFTIPNKGDLLSKIHLVITLPEINIKKLAANRQVSTLKTDINFSIFQNKIKEEYSNITKELNILDNFCKIQKEIIKEIIYIQPEINNINLSNNNFEYEDIINYFRVKITDLSNQYANNIDTVKIDKIMLSRLKIKDFNSKYNLFDIIEKKFNKNENNKLDNNDPLTYLIENYQSYLIKLEKVHKLFFNLFVSIEHKNNTRNNDTVLFAWVENLCHTIFEYVELFINDKSIVKHDTDWFNIISSLRLSYNSKEIYDDLIGNKKSLTELSEFKPSFTICVPMYFWFCNSYTQSFPLIAANKSILSLKIKFRNVESCCYIDKKIGIDLSELIHIDQALLYIDYIFLDNNSREQFAKSAHEYLIEQIDVIEFNKFSKIKHKFNLEIDHPVKSIYWFIQNNKYLDNKDDKTKCDFNYYGIDKTVSETVNNNIMQCSLLLNNIKFIDYNNETYFNSVKQYECYKNSLPDHVYNYSFALEPNEQQPSNTINMSCIKSKEFDIKFNPYIEKNDLDIKIKFISVYTNIIRIVNGHTFQAFA